MAAAAKTQAPVPKRAALASLWRSASLMLTGAASIVLLPPPPRAPRKPSVQGAYADVRRVMNKTARMINQNYHIASRQALDAVGQQASGPEKSE